MENTTPKLGIIESDPWLEPYSAAIEGRHQHALDLSLIHIPSPRDGATSRMPSSA